MFNKMRGSHIEPNLHIYINAIQTCCSLKDCEPLEIYNKMRESHIKPDSDIML